MSRIFLVAAMIALMAGAFARYCRKDQQLQVAIRDPLNAELSNLEKCLGAGVSSCAGSAPAMAEIEQRPEFKRVPNSLQMSILKLSRDEMDYEHLITTLSNEIDGQVAHRIRNLRTLETDRTWNHDTVKELCEAQLGQKAIVRGVQSEHAARSIAWDLHDPEQPVIIGPGGPVWRLEDWLEYPRTLLQVEACWSDLEFLYFDEMRDQWDYRITQNDLQRRHLSLREFADPIYTQLEARPEFTRLPAQRASLLRQISTVRTQLNQPFETFRRFSESLERLAGSAPGAGCVLLRTNLF